VNVPYALYVGNISPNKAPEILIQGLRALESKGRPLSVYHVGQDRELLSQAAKRAQLARPVESIGPLSDSSLAAAYARATCLIVTSTHEGFCLPVLDAQSLGTPVICSDIPVLREVAGDGALFFRSGDASDLARCLEIIFENGTIRRALSTAAQANAARFSWSKAAAEIEGLFMKVSTK